jgi:hypothetical protein
VNDVNRRTFLHLSTAALLINAATRLPAIPSTPAVTEDNGTLRVQGGNYLWQYTQVNDRFTLFDSQRRVIVAGTHQPAVVVAPTANPAQRISLPGRPAKHAIVDRSREQAGDIRITIVYEGVNGEAKLFVAWRFNHYGIWNDPVLYETTSTHDVVSLYYFSDNNGTTRAPSLHPSYLVVPGVISGSTVSPILHNGAGVNGSVWLGRGSSLPGFSQQWALPVHFFCGFSTAWPGPERNLYTEHKSDTFTCGLADLPGGDLFLEMSQGQASPWIDYRSDLWRHQRGPGRLTLGATWFWAVAAEYRESIAAYYQGLLHAGVVKPKQKSAHKTAVMLTPQFCTWGAQRAEDKGNDKLDEAFLNGLYSQLKASGMQAGLFSIDDKWEGVYGTLEHSAERLPNFERFLSQLRADGLRLGMWAAVMRCERPSDLGLTTKHMLQTPDGTPFVAHGANNASYYILDFTQPEVAKALTSVVRRFMRRYQPDLFKFDFGYELPSVRAAAPFDKQWTGERLMWKGLDIVISAMRAENPDIVVMYYNLSPLLLDFIDLHSPDDLWMDIGDYDIEANRRFYFSSLMGQLGVPTYGSSGYDWSSSSSIWFDSAAMGTIGSLNDFGGDEEGETPTPQDIARYNGITHVLRPTTKFDILPLDAVPIGPTLGAHARSWARFEEGELVLLAQRPPVPGEENRLMASRPVDPRVKDVLNSAAPVIIASRTNQGISRTSRLAIVPFGPEVDIFLLREQGMEAVVTAHYLHGAMWKSTASIVSNRLRIPVLLRHSSGVPLEWIDVEIE